METIKKRRSPAIVHLEDIMEHHNFKAINVAKELGIPRQYLSALISGKKKLNVDLCIRLEKWSGLRASFWMDLESKYRLKMRKKEAQELLSKVTKNELLRA